MIFGFTTMRVSYELKIENEQLKMQLQDVFNENVITYVIEIHLKQLQQIMVMTNSLVLVSKHSFQFQYKLQVLEHPQ